MKGGDITQCLPDLKANSPTNPGVDLVEDEGRHTIEPREDCLQRQRNARQLATRCDAREEPSLVTDVQSDTELDGLGACRAHIRQRHETYAKPPVGHPESG
jgi:hypothetical protein